MPSSDVFTKQFGELVGRGAQAAVYAQGDTAVKVYRLGYPKEFVFYEAMVMSYIETTALPVPKVYEVLCVNGQMALKMSRAMGLSLNAIMLGDLKKAQTIIEKIVDLQRQTHEKRIAALIGLKQKLQFLIAESASLGLDQKKALLKLCEKLPEGVGLCHGDFHGNNILYYDGVYTIIDWIDASSGCVLGDACHTYLIYSLETQAIADLYLEKYCAATGSKKKDVLRWLPVQAGSLLGQVPEKYNRRLLECIDAI